MGEHFVTSYGRNIEHVKGYRAAHLRPWNFVVNHTEGDHKRAGMHVLYGNTFAYGIVTDFLTRYGLWGGNTIAHSISADRSACSLVCFEPTAMCDTLPS